MGDARDRGHTRRDRSCLYNGSLADSPQRMCVERSRKREERSNTSEIQGTDDEREILQKRLHQCNGRALRFEIVTVVRVRRHRRRVICSFGRMSKELILVVVVVVVVGRRMERRRFERVIRVDVVHVSRLREMIVKRRLKRG